MVLVETAADVADLEVDDPNRIAYLTQTTLSVDDANLVIAALREKFPRIANPPKDDICYATQNRQNAVKELSRQADLLLVVGARNSSNTNRLREVGEQYGMMARLIESAAEIDSRWLPPAGTVAITAGASTPEVLVDEVIDRLRELGARAVSTIEGVRETTTFRLPADLHRPTSGVTELGDSN